MNDELRDDRPLKVNKEGMTARQQLFVIEYLKNPVGKEAAERAGFKSPAAAAVKLLDGKQYPQVCEAILQGMEEKRKKSTIEAHHIVEELAKVGFLNVKRLFDKEGSLLPVHELPDDVACCVKEFKVSQRVGMGAKGEQVKVRTVEVKLHDKLNALQQLANHLGFLKEVQVINTTNVVVDWGGLHGRRQIVDVVEQQIQAQQQLPAPDTHTTKDEV